MKTIYFLALLCLAGFSQDKKNDSASVDKVNGVYVFIHSRPVADYDVIKSGTVTMWGMSTGNISEIVSKPSKQAQKEKGDGVIIYLESKKYDVIKFK